MKKSSSVILQEHLEALDRQCSETMDRWAAPQDFSKIDLVCAELLKKGSFGDALEYMEKVKKVVEQLCLKLRAKHQESMKLSEMKAMEEEEDYPHDASRGSTPTCKHSLHSPLDPLPQGGGGGAPSPAPKMLMTLAPPPPVKADAKPGVYSELKRDFSQLTKQHKELTKQHAEDTKDYQEQIAELQARLASSSFDVKQTTAEVKANKIRLLNRKLEQQAADTRAVQAESRARVLEDRVDALAVLLRQAEGKTNSGNAQVQHMRQKVADLQQQWGEVGAREAKLAAQVAGVERQVAEREAELRATGKAATVALTKQDQTIARLQDRLDSQALELQRRDEILHTLSTRLQEKNMALVDFLTPPTSGSPTEGGTLATALGNTSLTSPPTGASNDESLRNSRQGSRPLSAALQASTVKKHKGGGGGELRSINSLMPPVRSSTAPEGRRRGGAQQVNGVQIRITENEGAGAAFKPWIIHQPIRCEPAAHIVVVGVQQLQSVERSQANDLSQQKVCCCGTLSSKGHFELMGHVMWRGRTAVIGPPLEESIHKHRSVLGLESPAENLLTAFS
eukprot:CAMPEP_0196585954 /NCGR_PEP_ID=MMETSP1081-20130531/52679_1 /TAXON_ID=36882 /ORGANISM="Pyramimonas amylifera, Strain CCMP720" /LENGTH=564 /DNA_ID=CAMNT_0041907673 /DNA_START=210 /DNA_END=1904 /DNA_ORIENTATION=-